VRILYIDIDSLRPDHLGCYGYHRNTSPNIDKIADKGIRFENTYISDAPCLPSRTALWSGRNGYHTGVVSHGGTPSQPFIEGIDRGHRDLFSAAGWMGALRQLGYRNATISPFGQRHAAWHWYASFHEIYDTGKGGNERADEVTPVALDWLKRNASKDNWFLHINLWDPHTPYRTPLDYGNPFEGEPLPAWLTEAVRRQKWEGFGPHSAQEPHGFGNDDTTDYPRLPKQLDSMDAVRQWIDGYDVGIRYADDHVSILMNALADANILDDTIIMISADHGENQGELNVWGDHQTADPITCRVPLIVSWPGLTQPRVDKAFHYHFDWAATMIELLGGEVPGGWDGKAFADAVRYGRDEGRDYLVTSQGTWAAQRGVRFDTYMLLRTYHDGYKELEDIMLFDLVDDPHEQHNLADSKPEVVRQGLALLETWLQEMALTSPQAVDPLMTAIKEDAFIYSRGQLPAYLERLRATGRAHHAERLTAKHHRDLAK
jgi:choline-sulfatase